jgi:hypothetical protein
VSKEDNRKVHEGDFVITRADEDVANHVRISGNFKENSKSKVAFSEAQSNQLKQLFKVSESTTKRTKKPKKQEEEHDLSR